MVNTEVTRLTLATFLVIFVLLIVLLRSVVWMLLTPISRTGALLALDNNKKSNTGRPKHSDEDKRLTQYQNIT